MTTSVVREFVFRLSMPASSEHNLSKNSYVFLLK